MTRLLLAILNISYGASWLVVAVLLARLVLKKAPRWIHVLLWAMVGLRLVCPFRPESMLSLVPSAEVISPHIVSDASPAIHTGIDTLDSAVNPLLAQSFAPNVGDSVDPIQVWTGVGSAIWLLGTAVMLLYAAVSYLRLRRRVADAAAAQKGIWHSGQIGSPFVLGLFRPRIYLPVGLPVEAYGHVVAHERAHIRRKDHWWKPIGFLLLSLHWFNPLMWLAYILLRRDIELACDEKVVRQLDEPSRADYSQALLDCSVRRSHIIACPLAFGEVGVKTRIKSILHYKKPGFWILLAAVTLCLLVSVCFLTDPAEVRLSPQFADKLLCVEIRDSYGSALSDPQATEPRYNYFDIRTFRNVTLPGGVTVDFSIKKIYADAIELSFSAGLRLGDATVETLRLEPGEAVALLAGDPGGSTVYTFSIIHKPDASQSPELLEWISAFPDRHAPSGVQLPEFPGVTFQFLGSIQRLDADGSVETLVDGMPVLNAYFADLTGDGKRELCATTCFGSGMIDTYVKVIDLAVNESFYLRMRGLCDYTLTQENGRLICVVTDYASGEELKRGRLVLAAAGGGSGRQLMIVTDDAKSEALMGGQDGPEDVYTTRDMTLSDLRRLAQMGEALTWADLAPFTCEDVGSGLYIMHYPISDAFYLLAGGGSTQGKPIYVRLVAAASGRYMDILEGDLETFLEAQSETGAGQSH